MVQSLDALSSLPLLMVVVDVDKTPSWGYSHYSREVIEGKDEAHHACCCLKEEEGSHQHHHLGVPCD